jgi:hypothetical protein
MNQSPSAATQWWKVLAAGSAVLIGFVVVTTLTGELSDSAWLPAMLVLLGAIVTIATGLVLGVIHFVETRREVGLDRRHS